MALDLWWVETPAPGRVGVVQRPRGGDWLPGDMAWLRTQGVDVIVSALQDKEIRDTHLLDQGHHASANGLHYVRFPIGNMLTPAAESLPALRALAGRVRRGERVVAHCFACVGRSPLIAASVLVLLGVPAEEAWLRVEQSRGCAVPDTLAQRLWVAQL
ncbi:MAG: tyrosine protein phosphatase, partial [Dehalococcoidia bacterium]